MLKIQKSFSFLRKTSAVTGKNNFKPEERKTFNHHINKSNLVTLSISENSTMFVYFIVPTMLFTVSRKILQLSRSEIHV